ncbi:hypothetical protein OSH12_18215 [Kaistia terrae]|nr:hypothetical protein [Kaistia terrae]
MTGLVNRRNAEGWLWVKGSFVSSASVPAEPPNPSVLTKPEILTPIAGAAGTVIAAANGPGPIAYRPLPPPPCIVGARLRLSRCTPR